MSELRAGIGVSGQAKTDVAFKFTPLDIVGHLTCPFPWTDDYETKANFNDQSIELDAKLELSFDNNKGRYKYSVAPMELEATLDPAPINLLIDAIGSTNMNLACPIAGIAGSITIPLRGYLPPIDRTRKIPTPVLNGAGSFDLPSVRINGYDAPLKIQNRQNALMFSL